MLFRSGAIIQSRLSKIIYATESNKFGYVESVYTLFEKNNHKVGVESGICKQESIDLLKRFFNLKRK